MSSPSPPQDIIDKARSWLTHDPDPATRAELERLLDAGSEELTARFSGPLIFGTAGLRGILGAGESRMNRAVVRRTTAGLAHYLLEQVPEAAARGVAVGYDCRRLSRELALETAQVLCAAGLSVWLSQAVCPTPLLCFAVQQLSAAGGVMITASHNPPEYNGYKVYAPNSAQIIPPADHLIAAAIDAAPPADQIPLLTPDEAIGKGLLHYFGPELEERYLETIRSLYPACGAGRSLPIVYTPLHGVGDKLLRAALDQAGFSQVTTVPEQAEPDGSFPTVEYPNPEEPGALDYALALARQQAAELIIANDPDADRLSIAVKVGAGSYRQLTGNEVGVLLGHHLLTQATASGQVADKLIIATVVSSPQLGAIARRMGARYEETLTGFKWICNRAMQLEAEAGAEFVFGYEEALGYAIGTGVRDKDGISAAVVLATCAAELHAQGQTLAEELDRIAASSGLFVSAQVAVRFAAADGLAEMEALMARLRDNPPSHIADLPVAAITDLLSGQRLLAGDGAPGRLELPASNVLIYELGDGASRVVVRPSGTEPKLKLYFDVCEPLREGERSAEAARERATARLAELQADMLRRAGAQPC